METISSGTIQGGTVLVENGRIKAVGAGLSIPIEADIVDASGMTVTPGLIDAHTHIGTCPEGTPYSMTDENDMTDPSTPQLRILDSIYPFDEAFGEARKGGVTAVQVLPGSANVIGGQGAVIKTRGLVVDEMAVLAPSGMKAALGENPIGVYKEKNQLPTTRMGNAACMRNTLQEAFNYKAAKEHWLAKKDEDKDPFDIKPGMEALLPVVEKKMPLRVHCHRADDIATAVRTAEEFGIELTLEHCTEGHLIPDYLASKKVMAAVGPTLSCRPKIELRHMTWDTLKVFSERAIHFCIITDHPVTPVHSLMLCATMAHRAGLSREEALRAVTLSSAEHLGLEARMGSLEPGKDGDIVLWKGDPFDARTEVAITFIDGAEVYRA
ncbi:amidohydrolase [Dethiosulfovibrio peptidovorans]|nr:amidohydrolase [Dethiosulfovibrio peptidovorans]